MGDKNLRKNIGRNPKASYVKITRFYHFHQGISNLRNKIIIDIR